MRAPLGARQAGPAPPEPFGSPTKLTPAPGSAPDPSEITQQSVERNAALVLQALEAESPPRAAGSQGSGTADLAQLYAAAQPGGAPPTSAGAGGSATPPDPLPPAASSGQLQPVDTLLIRRLASDVAHSSDVVAAWEEVESLRQALRLKDAELASALEALAAAQAFGESPGAVQRHSETAGQQLARFLKDQLAMRDGQLAAAQAEAAELRAALADSEERRIQLEAALSEAQADAGYARLEAEEARRDAAAQLAAMRSELWAAEARANLAAYGTPEGNSWEVAQEQQPGSISLQQPGTAYHSAGDEAGTDGQGDDGDVFSSPMLTARQWEGRASSSPSQPQPEQQQQQQQPASGSFQFVSAAGDSSAAAAGPAASDDDAASSGGESEVTVSEAAVVARTLTRASALQKDREQLRAQVRDLSQELRDLKGKQKQMAQHMQAAAGGSSTPLLPSAARGRRHRTPARGEADATAAGGDAALAEQCRLAAVEERHLRSEVETLNRKCEKSNEMLLKANHAMKILHYKLQKERKAVGCLQEEKCQLQAQLLAGGGAAGGAAVHTQQLATLLGELQEGRARIEGLLQDKAVLAAKLEALATGTPAGGRQQREAAAAALSALQQQQEAAVATAREELAVERARAASLAEERATLEGRLQEALARLGAAEQISGHLEQMNAYLQEERQRCQLLASQLGREQQGSESRAAEVARLAALAQHSTEEVMAAREAAQAERSRAEALAHDKAELQGRVDALQETLARLEKDDALLRLTEDKAALQLAVRDAESAAAAAQASADERQRYAAEAEATCAELRRQLDAALTQTDVAHAAVEGAADQLQRLTDSHEAMEQQLAAAGAELAAAQAEAAARAQQAQQAEAHCVELDAELHQALQQRDEAASAAQEAQRQLAAAQQDAAAAAAQVAEAAQRLAAAAADREELAGKLADLRAENKNLRDNLKALHAECEAVRTLGSSMDQTNQALVDGMCDMSGLVDAVQALQTRNRLLQADLDTLKAKYADLHRSSEAQARSLQGTQKDLVAARDQVASLGAAQAELHEERGRLQAELASARQQAAAAQQAQQEADQQRAAVQERLTLAESALGDSRQLAANAQEQHAEAAAAAAEMRQQLAAAQQAAAEAQQRLAAAAGEKQEWAQQRGELQEQVAALQKAQAVADGKLVVARQREAQFKEASKQLKVLQQELQAFVSEGQAQRQKLEEAEARREALEARCLELEASSQALAEQLAAAQEEREALSTQRAALEAQLGEARLHVAQLEQQQETFASVQQRLSELETEQHTSGEWFDALTAELSDKTDQLAALQLRLQDAEQQASEAGSQLEAAQQRAAELAEAQAAATAAHAEAAAALEQAQQQVGEVSAQLETAEAVAAETTVQLLAAQAGCEVAEAAVAEAQQRAEQAEQGLHEVRQQLAAAEAAASEAAAQQQERIEQLNRGLFVMGALHAAHVRQAAASASAAAEQHAAALAEAEERCAAVIAAAEQRCAATEQQHEAAVAEAGECHTAALAAAEEQHAAVLASVREQHRQEVATLEQSLSEASAQLHAVSAEHAAAAERLAQLDSELLSQARAAAQLEERLTEAQEVAAAAAVARDDAEARHAAAAAEAAAGQRQLEMLEQQCSVLREQLAFLHEQQQSDTDEAAALKTALAAATADATGLRQQLADAQTAAAEAAAAQERAQQAAESAEWARQAASEREAELRQQLADASAAIEAAQGEAERAQREAGEAEGRAEHLLQQLEAEEELRRGVERQLDAAAAEREQEQSALAARAQVRDLLEGLSDRLAAQQDLLLRLEAGSSPAASGGSGPAGAEALVARRDLLAQALEKLQDLKSENEGLWASLESHLSGEGGSAGAGSSSGGGRPNQYLAHLQAERQQLADQLAAARQQHAEAASRLAAAQAAIAKLQAVVQRLSAAGGIEAGSELRGLLSPFPAGADSLPAAAPSPSAAAVSGGASGSGLFEAELQWQAEKRLLKAICKLALAVTMDQVGGRHEAAALADELAPLMAAHAAALQQLGLQKVWASLHRLAKAGGTGGTPSRGTPSQASAPPPAQQQQAQQQQVVPAAPTEQQAVQLPQDVWALQQRVRQYKAKCKELKATVVAMQGAAARWQAQAGEVEQGLALLRFRLDDLLSEVKWVLEDYSDSEAAAQGDGALSSHQLNALVEELSRGLRRILRKYRTLSNHLHASREGSQRQQPQELSAHSEDGATSSGGRAGSGWEIPAARRGGGGAAAGTASEAMAEAGRKAAAIAEKLDRLLTPQSRAVVHGGAAGVPKGSRFAAEACAAAGEEGAAEWQSAAAGRHEVWGLAGLAAGEATDVDDIPLRQRFGGATSSCSLGL